MKKRIVLGVVLLGSVLLISGNTTAQNDESPSIRHKRTVMSPVDVAVLPTVAVPEVKPVVTTQAPQAPPSQPAVRQPAVQPTYKAPVAPVQPKSPTVKTYYLSPVTAIESQAMVDSGYLVTWNTSPTCLIAGHDNMGWAWLDDMQVGAYAVVKTGPCVGRYKIVGHKWQSTKGGPYPPWLSNYAAVFMTCTGSSGTGFSVAVRA